MRKMSRNALELCRECRERLFSEIVRVQEDRSPNYKAISGAVDVILTLNIHTLLGIKPGEIENSIKELRALRASVVPEEGDFPKNFVIRNINIMLKCLKAGVIPDSNIWLGSLEDAEEALRRLADEIEL